jgi:hypothetical protein
MIQREWVAGYFMRMDALATNALPALHRSPRPIDSTLACTHTFACRGDQHDTTIIEYFLTENLLAHFNQILLQRSNRRGNVATQVLQVRAWGVVCVERCAWPEEVAHARTHAHTHAHAYMHTHTRTHTCMHTRARMVRLFDPGML